MSKAKPKKYLVVMDDWGFGDTVINQVTEAYPQLAWLTAKERVMKERSGMAMTPDLHLVCVVEGGTLALYGDAVK